MKKISKFLFRALNKDEISNQNIPLPRSQKPFKDYPRLGLGSAILPFTLDETEEHAVIHHQTDSTKFPTKGISTTPNVEIAKKYASKNGVIIKINADKLEKFGVKAYVVNEWVKNKQVIIHPEDNEIILVSAAVDFPESLIEEVIIL